MKVLIKDARINYAEQNVKIRFSSLDDYEKALERVKDMDKSVLWKDEFELYFCSAINQKDPYILFTFKTLSDTEEFFMKHIVREKVAYSVGMSIDGAYLDLPDFELRSLSDFGGETFTATIDNCLSPRAIRTVLGLDPVKLDTSKKEELEVKYDATLSDFEGYKFRRYKNNMRMNAGSVAATMIGCVHNTNTADDLIKKIHVNYVKEVITIVWIDGEVTMAKCGPNDIFDPEKGIAIAFMKRFFPSGTKFNKWMKEEAE